MSALENGCQLSQQITWSNAPLNIIKKIAKKKSLSELKTLQTVALSWYEAIKPVIEDKGIVCLRKSKKKFPPQIWKSINFEAATSGCLCDILRNAPRISTLRLSTSFSIESTNADKELIDILEQDGLLKELSKISSFKFYLKPNSMTVLRLLKYCDNLKSLYILGQFIPASKIILDPNQNLEKLAAVKMFDVGSYKKLKSLAFCQPLKTLRNLSYFPECLHELNLEKVSFNSDLLERLLDKLPNLVRMKFTFIDSSITEKAHSHLKRLTHIGLKCTKRDGFTAIFKKGLPNLTALRLFNMKIDISNIVIIVNNVPSLTFFSVTPSVSDKSALTLNVINYMAEDLHHLTHLKMKDIRIVRNGFDRFIEFDRLQELDLYDCTLNCDIVRKIRGKRLETLIFPQIGNQSECEEELTVVSDNFPNLIRLKVLFKCGATDNYVSLIINKFPKLTHLSLIDKSASLVLTIDSVKNILQNSRLKWVQLQCVKSKKHFHKRESHRFFEDLGLKRGKKIAKF